MGVTSRSKFLNSFFFFSLSPLLQGGDTVQKFASVWRVVLESSLMSVVYVLISPESDRHADIQYDRFPLHACDQDMRVRRDSQVLQWRRPSKLDSWCLPGSEVFQSLICVVFLVGSFLWLENGSGRLLQRVMFGGPWKVTLTLT